MLSKLALRNAKRSYKDYLIYLFTITISFALIFSFNLIIFTPDINELSTNMEAFQIMIVFVSVIIVFIIGILINYMNKFIFEKRSREFGTYLLLGIEKNKIAKLFLLEQIGLGLFSLLIAFLIGCLFSQLFTAIIMNIFNLPYIIKFNFSLEALFLTALYFILIYLVVLFKSQRRIKKMKIHDLIYFDKINETTVFKNKTSHHFIFIISTLIGIAGLYLFYQSFTNVDNFEFSKFLISLILIIISIYGISITLPNFILFFLLKSPKIKYHHDHLFVLRHLTSKINTLGITLGTLTLLIATTMVCLNVSNLFTQAFNYQTELILPYDLKVSGEDSDFSMVTDFIKEHYTIDSQVSYHVYTDETDSIDQLLHDNEYYASNVYLALSDYNRLTALLGMEPVSLNDDQFLINCSPDQLAALKKQADNIKLYDTNGQLLNNKNIISEHFTTSWTSSNITIVVPDALVNGLNIMNSAMIINTLEETVEQFFYDAAELEERVIIGHDDEGEPFYSYANIVQVRGYYLAQNRTAMTTLAFTLLYLSFIFIAVTGTILAIQCLTDSTKYAHRYRLLNQLGMDKAKIHLTIFKHLAFTFIYPLIYPLIICIVVSFSINNIFLSVLPSINTIWYLTGLTFLMFGIIYSIYFITTYIEFKKNIHLK